MRDHEHGRHCRVQRVIGSRRVRRNSRARPAIPGNVRSTELLPLPRTAVDVPGRSSTLGTEMSNPHPEPAPDESLELPVDELLRRGRSHPPYGEQVIDDLTSEEAEAFLDAVLS